MNRLSSTKLNSPISQVQVAVWPSVVWWWRCPQWWVKSSLVQDCSTHRANPLSFLLGLPSGYVNIAIENGHWNSGFTHWTWWFSIVFLYVYQAGYATWNRLRQSHVPWLWLVFCRRCYAATADADFGGFHTLLAGSRLNSMTFPVKPPFSGDFPWVFPTWWLIPLSKWIITPVIYMG